MEEKTFDEHNQYLTFTLGDELFALNIASVREILDDKEITRIPRTPPAMRGVLNVRGHAVPVVDLRRKFGMSPTQMTVNTCVIIIERSMDGEEQQNIGALADSVQEVIEMTEEMIDPPPRMGASIDAAYIKGMGKSEDGFIIILDAARLFSDEELAGAVAATEESQAA